MPDDQKKTDKAAEKPPADAEEPTDSYWLVLFADALDKPPQCIRCENAESLTRAIEENVLKATDVLHVFGFKGQRIEISAPRPVCSFKIDGEKTDVGQEHAVFDEGGRITPLAKPEPSE
jgi:hypothetical protein